MERHDPLGSTAPLERPPPAEPKKRVRKAPPILREVAAVKDDTLAFLYGGPDQQPGDYSLNLQRAPMIREDFVAFCAANHHFSNWRQAWAAFMSQYSTEPVRQFPQPAETPAPPIAFVKAPAPPRWKQRLYQIARA